MEENFKLYKIGETIFKIEESLVKTDTRGNYLKFPLPAVIREDKNDKKFLVIKDVSDNELWGSNIDLWLFEQFSTNLNQDRIRALGNLIVYIKDYVFVEVDSIICDSILEQYFVSSNDPIGTILNALPPSVSLLVQIELNKMGLLPRRRAYLKEYEPTM